MHSSFLFSQMVSLEESLRHLEPCTALFLLSRRFLEIVADSANPSNLHLQASRCLGQIGSGAFREFLNMDCTLHQHASDWLTLTNFETDSLMTFTTFKVLEILLRTPR